MNKMDLYTTEIRAIDPRNGLLKTWCGPHVPGISFSDAEEYCQRNGLGYCAIVGRLVEEIPCKPGTYEPDWDRKIDHEKPTLN